MNKTVKVQLLSASKEYMVDRIFHSVEFKGENNTEGIHGDGKAGSTEIRLGQGQELRKGGWIGCSLLK